MIASIYPIENQVIAQQQDQAISFTVQTTSMSAQDPLPGHEAHQAVIAATPREDGKIYLGVATFTASQSVKAVVLHRYTPSQASNQAHGEPLNTPFGNGKVAISDEAVYRYTYQCRFICVYR
jgi:redox-regulated HSP33 family molecular chaperone